MSDFAHMNLLAALKGVAAGKQLDQFVPTQSFGKKVKIFDALNKGVELSGTFHADHMDVVNAAFEKIGSNRPNDNIRECSRAMLTTLFPKRAQPDKIFYRPSKW